MFDIFAKFLSSIASFLFPLFASYKALKTSDPAQLTPWLMYWVVLACGLLVESWIDWFLVWIPFYAYIRLLFLLYLVLPQTQGARLIYEEYIHPRLEENETAIEEFIASAHERLRSTGIAYLNRAIELLKTNILGMAPSPPTAAAAAPPQPQTAQSYTQSLLARFTTPSPRWTTTPAPPTSSSATGASLATDLFALLSSVTAAATTPTPSSSTTSSTNTRGFPTGTSSGAGATGGGGSIIPDAIRAAGAAARVSFVRAQRERLRFVLSALDREEEDAAAAEAAAAAGTSSGGSGGYGGSGGGGVWEKRESVSEQSVGSGLSKSRSEGDFEKLDAPSGGEEEEGAGAGGGVRRRGGVEAGKSAAGWMPWGWGGGAGGAGGEGGRSSRMEK
ncbi:TB2/DP1, HVA22 family-domain-containing protein [Chaetomium tenue]|uniref:TB2/DP1, HVA22 family-domain-containing protein n=1 Tax=Chaetomium tenue TaxID=1854479 RepID=A0ACB7NWH4_9PEZI|nr:TB2/DP1, HVA22 family-domain-containing protein [Chaetomium globosum]